jgi:surface carbohydrate biosynthesis protein
MRILGRSVVLGSVATCDVLQIGGTAISGFDSLREEYRLGVMPLLGERIHLRVALGCLLRWRLSRWSYYALVAQLSQARLILIWHDTIGIAPHLYRHVKIPIILVQNGMRGDVAPVDGLSFRDAIATLSPHPPKVDTYFVFGEQSETFLRPIVNAKYVRAGSFRLNEYALTRRQLAHERPEEVSLGLIVSFPNKKDVPTGKVVENQQIFVSISRNQLSYHSYFRIDGIVAQVAAGVARELGVSLSIIGKRKDSDGLEREFFASIPGCENVPVLGHEKGSGYEVAERFTHLLAIDSTLGYEMLALGKRVGFVANRIRVAGIESSDLTFGHPLSIPSDGPFWTSASTPAGIRDFVLRFLRLSDSEWAEQHQTITPRVMELDRGNTMLRAHIDAVLGRSG